MKKKKNDDDRLIERIQDFITNLFSSHRGYVDTPAAIYALRDKFGPEVIMEHRDMVDQTIESAKERYEDQDIMAVLPSAFEGQPMKAEPQGATITPLFEHIKGIG